MATLSCPCYLFKALRPQARPRPRLIIALIIARRMTADMATPSGNNADVIPRHGIL
ncbi:hypothetical protein [Desulfoluna sp.]|uniref:hypothetical protein n=1 Tax=Desulfoluna sp. TaxID=2045199 RepID=UPI00261E3947|nr:hypothetical protein [Desulfoluna sp.]